MTLENLRKTGVSAETVNNMMIDAGAVYFIRDGDESDLENPDVWEIFGATRDGNEFNVDQEFRMMPVDGVPGPSKGFKRIISVEATLTVNILEFTTDVLETAFPGATTEEWPEGEPTHDHIFRDAAKIELADYIDYVLLVGEKHCTGEPIVCYIKNGLQDESIEVSTADEDEANPTLTFSGHFDVENPTREPWGILNPVPAGAYIKTNTVLYDGQEDFDVDIDLYNEAFDAVDVADFNTEFELADGTGSLDSVLEVDDHNAVLSFSVADGSLTSGDIVEITLLASGHTGEEDSNTITMTVK